MLLQRASGFRVVGIFKLRHRSRQLVAETQAVKNCGSIERHTPPYQGDRQKGESVAGAP